MPFPFVGNLGEVALFALGESSEGDLAVAMTLGVVPGGKLAHLFAKSGLGSFIGKIGASAWKSAKQYAGKAGSILGKGARGLIDRAGQFLRRKPGSACGCFTAGTVVWTMAGLVPIEQVEVGDVVMTFDEETKLPVVGTVTDQIITEGAALLELTVRHASGRLETIQTTDEHPFWREADGHAAEGWARADALSPGDRVRTLSGSAIVERVRFGSERTTVYNLSVSTDPSFLVGDDGVWVHNCGFDQLFKVKYEHFMHRKGWDTILGRSNPSRREVAEILENIVAENGAHLSRLQPGGVEKIDILGVHNGHTIYVQVSSRSDGLYEITSAGLVP